MEILGVLFGSPARVRIMRLFLLHPGDVFSAIDIARKSKTPLPGVRKELALLLRVSFLKKKMLVSASKKSVPGFVMNADFPLLTPIRTLLVDTKTLKTETIVNRIKNAGKIKLIVVSGVFLHEDESRIDMLVVGDDLKKGVLEAAVRAIEAEVGKELAYASLETAEFRYRLGMYDKFIRDIFDSPHERIFDRLE